MSRRTPPPAKRLDPTAPAVLQSVPIPALRYPIRLRLNDWWGGRRDGRRDLTGLGVLEGAPAGGTGLTPTSSAWLAHNQAQEVERHDHELLAYQSHTVQVAIRCKTVDAALADAETERDTCARALAALPALSADQQSRRGAAEAHTPEAVIQARRSREHHASTVAPARRRLADAEAQVASLRAELHDLVARLDTLLEVTETRQARISEYHQRRAAVYRRAYLRNVPMKPAPELARLQHLPRT